MAQEQSSTCPTDSSAEEQSSSHDTDSSAAVREVKLRTVEAVRAANALPKLSEGYELCASFPVFSALMLQHQRRIISLMRDVFRNAGCVLSIPTDNMDIDELADRIGETNDIIYERAGILIDLLKKAKTMDEVVIPQQIVDAETTAIGQCNLLENQSRYSSLLARLPNSKNKPDELKVDDTDGALLAVKEKPQVVYGIEVDNSNSRFIPKLKNKYHELETSLKNLYIVDESSDGINTSNLWRSDEAESSHPYSRELIHFKVPEKQLSTGLVHPLKAISDTELTYVEKLDQLEKLREILNMGTEFSVDLEHNWHRSFLGLTCLVQISTRTADYIIDPFPLWNDMHILNEPFTNPNILKVFHGPESDILWLQRDFGIYVVNMFDTHKAMKALNFSKFSYHHLVQSYCKHTLDKKLQKADWRKRPLSDAHKVYARSDTHYLLHCYDQLRNNLIAAGNGSSSLLSSVYAESTKICASVYEKPVFISDGYEKLLTGRKPLDSRQHFALKALYKWRDEQARTYDESPQYILPNHMMLQIAEVLPREMQGILACCYPIPVHVKQELHSLHQMISTARDQPLVKPSIYGPCTGPLSFENLTFRLNRMTPLKALLSHFDFSSTKYNEEIRPLVVQDVGNAVQEKSAINCADPPTIYVLGEQPVIETERLNRVKKRLESWATPYECYQVAIAQRKMRLEKESQEAEAKKTDKTEHRNAEGKKLWSHLDPPANKPEYREQKTVVAELQIENEARKNVAQEIIIDEGMTLTKEKLKHKRKLASSTVSIPVPEKTNRTELAHSEDVKNRSHRSNWTVAAEKCEEQMDYDVLDRNQFNTGATSSSNVYDPFKRNRGGNRYSSGRGISMQTKAKPWNK
ncbi:unnamed protein product [Thelazia callipaeda]|uniref:HRDC domain-containing protein n=1 Tax=Thelazia callipaeda TaxID=103827 RepID=A0A0N5D1H2_THECL|nr:unnamed protein product [Thelazia callipaeda]